MLHQTWTKWHMHSISCFVARSTTCNQFIRYCYSRFMRYFIYSALVPFVLSKIDVLGVIYILIFPKDILQANLIIYCSISSAFLYNDLFVHLGYRASSYKLKPTLPYNYNSARKGLSFFHCKSYITILNLNAVRAILNRHLFTNQFIALN